MKPICPTIRILIALCALTTAASSQTLWDGGGGDSLWSNPLNWAPDGVPTAGSEVVLDHSACRIDYPVALPSGSATVSLARLRVQPATGRAIRLLLPRDNNAAAALRLTGSGDCLVLGNGSQFTNSSGAASGDPIVFSGTMRLENGATYVHNTARGNARVVERLSTAPGTEKGVFIFDVPGSSAYTVSLSGRTFGSLVFKSAAAGAPKRYNGSGSNPLTIRGGLAIESGATLGSTLTADIRLTGVLRLEGTLSLGPSTGGTTDRCLVLTGPDSAYVSGSGSLVLLNNFRNIVADTGSIVTLLKDLQLATSGQSFVLKRNSTLVMDSSIIAGQGRFINEPQSTLCIGSADGIRHAGGLGNIQTALCELDSSATYVFTRDGPQSTGDGLPRRIRTLKTSKPSGSLTLSKDTEVYASLHLDSGRIATSAQATLTLSGHGLFSPPNAYGDSNAGWERGYVDGPLRRVSTDTGLLAFPIGSDSAFAPLKIWRVRSGPLTFRVEYRPRPYDRLEPVSNPPLGQVSGYEHWEVRAEGAASDPASFLALSWRSAQGHRDSWRDSLRIAQYENRGIRLQWESVGELTHVTGTGNRGYVRSDRPWGSFGILTLASASPFGVLDRPESRLEASLSNGGVLLRWNCASASSCDGCELQRSGDGALFTVIHDRKPTGPTTPGVLAHTDRRPLPGRNLYRVSCRQVDGGRGFSEVATVIWRLGGEWRIHPNPTSGILNVEVGEGMTPSVFTITDAIGGTVHGPMRLEDGSTRIDLSGLRPGLYILQGTRDGRRWSLPFLKR